MTRIQRALGQGQRISVRVRFIGAALAVVACGRQDAPRADSLAPKASAQTSVAPRADSTSVAQPAPAPRSADSASRACVSEGDWQLCSVEKRLTDAGFVPIKKGAAPASVFPVSGTSYALGAAVANVYVFSSAKKREDAVAAIDTVTVSRRGSPSSWPLPPTLITSNNVAVVLVSDDGRLIERVQNAITAGLPRASH